MSLKRWVCLGHWTYFFLGFFSAADFVFFAVASCFLLFFSMQHFVGADNSDKAVAYNIANVSDD